MTARKHQALGKGLGALFPTELKTPEASQQESPQVSDTDAEEKNRMEAPQESEKGSAGNENPQGSGGIQQAAIEDDEASDVISKEMNGIAVQQIPLHEIQANRYQPRHEFDESALEELKESIVQHGVLQPILVRQLPAGKGYELVAGERRFRASRLAGLAAVPALVRLLSAAASTVIALIEKLQREERNAIDEANAHRNLLQNFRLTQQALAERVGKSRSHRP